MDVEALIELLCTTAGMIMENASAPAILHDDDLPRRVDGIVEAARDLSALSEAAARLARRLPTTVD